MSLESSQLVATLRQINAMLEALIADIDDELPAAPDIAQKLSGRICLQCGKVVPADEQYRRGLCVTHYEATRRKLMAREVSDSELVAHGLIAPPRSGGKSRGSKSALDEYLESRDESPDEVADRLQEMGRELTRKKSAKGKKHGTTKD